ncbi:MAG: twin-arginine translocase subunit TatC [Anaerolineaceae bacterium]
MYNNLTMSLNEFLPGIGEHILELRKRLLAALLGLLAATMGSFSLANQAIEILAKPVGGLDKLQAIGVTESVGVFMKVSLLGGFIIALPLILYEILAFVLPGLKSNEKGWLIGGIPIATLLFAGGVAFAYFVMLPTAVPFLVGFLNVQTIPRLSDYISFVTNLMFWFGLCFETPLLVFLLAKLHIVSAGMLLRQWRLAIVIISIIAAVATPTVDPVNMALLMAPLMVLYLMSILLALVARPPARREKPSSASIGRRGWLKVPGRKKK